VLAHVSEERSTQAIPSKPTLYQGEYPLIPRFTGNSSQVALKTPTPQNKPPPGYVANNRCYKCQGLRYIASKCPNRRVITLAKYQVVQEGEIEEEMKVYLMEHQEEDEVVAEQMREICW